MTVERPFVNGASLVQAQPLRPILVVQMGRTVGAASMVGGSNPPEGAIRSPCNTFQHGVRTALEDKCSRVVVCYRGHDRTSFKNSLEKKLVLSLSPSESEVVVAQRPVIKRVHDGSSPS